MLIYLYKARNPPSNWPTGFHVRVALLACSCSWSTCNSNSSNRPARPDPTNQLHTRGSPDNKLRTQPRRLPNRDNAWRGLRRDARVSPPLSGSARIDETCSRRSDVSKVSIGCPALCHGQLDLTWERRLRPIIPRPISVMFSTHFKRL